MNEAVLPRALLTPLEKAQLSARLHAMGREARRALATLSELPAAQKTRALEAAAHSLRAATPALLEANEMDCREAEIGGQNAAFIDRLRLTPTRIADMATSLEAIAALPDPVGRVLKAWQQPNGLMISRVSTPLGVIGVIFESRPNVTADAAALCLKAGNAVILRTGSGALRSALAIHAAMQAGLLAEGIPEAAIQLVPVADREAVGLMLAGLDGALDVIVPRGGKSLVARVKAEARVPVFAHLDGNNHVYVNESAALDRAIAVLLNAKMRRTSVCGAAETLLVDEACAQTHLAPLITALLDAGCAVRGDAAVQAVDQRVTPASTADWDTEFSDAIIAARVVPGLEAALDHIARHGSGHTDCIIAEDEAAAKRFLSRVDSAIVLHNASTQFADGGEFGFGAEIGIATGRMHARGPVGVEQLTSFKYCVTGHGTIRP